LRPTLILFARPPRLGRVKRRLARDVGDVAAWRWYRRQLGSLLRRLGRDPRWRSVLALSADGRPAWPARSSKGWFIAAQAGPDLGRRMARAFGRDRCGPRVLVGSDIPDVRPDHVAAAIRALGRAEVVLGPALDGGFWLVALRRPARAVPLFRGVRWSTSHALADVLANLDRRDRVAVLSPLRDVDSGADLRTSSTRG
jgi:hypothetical protein